MSLNSLDYKYSTSSRLHRSNAKMMILGENIIHSKLYELPNFVQKDAVMVINDSATIPASLMGTNSSGDPVELRLMMNLSSSPGNIRRWKAVLFGSGNWRMDTRDRPLPPQIEDGRIFFGGLQAKILARHPDIPRLVEIEFCDCGDNLWEDLYQNGKPVQYSHLNKPLHLWDVQTIFATLPVSMEPPSALFQFNWELFHQLRQKITIVPITHAISISSTGDQKLDEMIPFPERYWIGDTQAQIINNAIDEHRPIIAVGTSVTRALEDSYNKFGRIKAGPQITSLIINKYHKRRVVTDLLTGMHLPKDSHIELMKNFVNEKVLLSAYQSAVQNHYLWHEYGDVSFIRSNL